MNNSDFEQSTAPLRGPDAIVSNLPNQDQNGTTLSTTSFPASDTFFQDLLGVSTTTTTSTTHLPLLPPALEFPPAMSFENLNGELDFAAFLNADMFPFESADAANEAASPVDEQRASRAPSSESEGSNIVPLDADAVDPTFDLSLPMLTGSGPPAYAAAGGGQDPTMATLFGADFGVNQSLSALLNMFGPQPPQQQAAGVAPSETTANVFTISPSQLSTPLEGTPTSVFSELPAVPAPVSMKRKLSESSVDTTTQPKKRGRPPKNQSLDLAASTVGTPKPKRQSVKPSVAKPKAVVPQKFLRDGSAQKATGMTEQQILAYPDFEALLLAVAPELKSGAAHLGEQIELGRRQAAESAQSNRAAKDAKLNAALDEIQRLKAGFLELYQAGHINEKTYLQMTGA